MDSTLEQLRAACTEVSCRARSVRIEEDQLSAYAEPLAASVAAQRSVPPDAEMELLVGSVEQRAAFWLYLDAINFGSGWFLTLRVLKTWHVGGTPDMGGLSPDGTVFWAGGRYIGTVYAFSTRTCSIPAGISPHGVCVWPQPGRHSTGHTGVMR